MDRTKQGSKHEGNWGSKEKLNSTHPQSKYVSKQPEHTNKLLSQIIQRR